MVPRDFKLFSPKWNFVNGYWQAQKEECWTWNQRSEVQYSLGQHFVTEIFCFHVVKPLVPILELLPISSSL